MNFDFKKQVYYDKAEMSSRKEWQILVAKDVEMLRRKILPNLKTVI